MAKPFDATLKQLIDRYGNDWIGFVCEAGGLPADTVWSPLDPDLGTISPQSDKLFRVEAPLGGVIHLELQTGWAGDLPPQLQLYNTLAEYRHGGPVRTVLLLLRPEADAAAATGLFTRTHERGEYLRFHYQVLRLWEFPCERLLNGPLGLLPLALLTNDARDRLPELLSRVEERFQSEAPTVTEHAESLTACHILLGLRYDKVIIQALFRELRTMRESTTYQAILEEGQELGLKQGQELGLKQGLVKGVLQGLRESVSEIAVLRLGDAPADFLARLEAITDHDHLRRLRKSALLAADWHQLLDQM